MHYQVNPSFFPSLSLPIWGCFRCNRNRINHFVRRKTLPRINTENMLCGLEIIQQRFTDDQLLFFMSCVHVLGFVSNDFACISARNALRRVSYLTEEVFKWSRNVWFLFSVFYVVIEKVFQFFKPPKERQRVCVLGWEKRIHKPFKCVPSSWASDPSVMVNRQRLKMSCWICVVKKYFRSCCHCSMIHKRLCVYENCRHRRQRHWLIRQHMFW